jgi:regulator-associated protein of mTOR
MSTRVDLFLLVPVSAREGDRFTLRTLPADGVVRLYRNHDPAYYEDPPQLVSSFWGLPAMQKVTRGAGLVSDWNQYEGTLLVAGDSRSILAWNARRERADHVSYCTLWEPRLTSIQTIETDTDSVVTDVEFAPGQNAIFVASFADGSMKVYDRRRGGACVQQWHEHNHWIQRVRWRPRETKEIVSAW